MWISFTLMAAAIALSFWVMLVTSLRLNYKKENLETLDRMTWTAMREYGTSEFFNNLKFIAGGESCFIQVLSEENNELLLSLDNDGEKADVQADGIIPDDLFKLLDENAGCYSFCVEDTARNAEWAVEAIVIAAHEGSREVLILSKLLTNIDYLLHVFNTRVIYALLIAILIASVLSFLITKAFAGPVNRLTDKAQQLAAGDYKVTFPKEGCCEVRQLSETLEMAAQEFNATEELRREFVANISQDMKTPLTVIQMYAEMIQTVSGDNPVKREEHLERIITEVEKLTGFINDTMELAKLQSRTWEVKRECFDISHLIQSSLMSFEIHHELNDFEIEQDLEEGLFVNADRKLISRVLENFISNALKFSLNEKKIKISAKKEGGDVKVSVRDYGTGIEADKLPHIWERYYKVDPYGSNKAGTGVGLHIVKEIMEMHEAEYGVESRPGEGSCFWFCLKAVQKAER